MSETTKQTEPKKGNGKKVFVIVLILVLVTVVCALGAVVYQLLQKEPVKETISNGVPSGPKRNTIVTMENKDEILSDLNNKVSGGMFEAKMNVEWYFEDSSKPSLNAYVANAVTNGRTIYFDLVDDATGNVIYESPYIPIGAELKNIVLSSKLEKGTHKCTLTYHLIDEKYEDVSTTSVAVTVTVYN